MDKKSVPYTGNEDLFELIKLKNHSESIATLQGKHSKRSYSMRKDGDELYVLKDDIAADPDKFKIVAKDEEPETEIEEAVDESENEKAETE